MDESNIKWQWQKCLVRRYAVSIILANISIECNFVVIRLIELSGSYKITTRKALFLEKKTSSDNSSGALLILLNTELI